MEISTTKTHLVTDRTHHRVGGKRSASGVAAVVIAVAAGLMPSCSPAQQIPVLDLTKPPPPDARSMGVPGTSAGAILGGERPIFFPPRYKLPLEITIRGFRTPAPGARAAIVPKPPDWALELLVKNVGDQPYDLPVGRDPAKAHRPGNKGRRTFLYFIRPENTTEKLIDLPLIGSADGSESAPDSILRIEPQSTVLVLLPVDMTPIARVLPKQAVAANVRVLCKEWALADDKYAEEKRSEDVESQNVIAIPIPRATTIRNK